MTLAGVNPGGARGGDGLSGPDNFDHLANVLDGAVAGYPPEDLSPEPAGTFQLAEHADAGGGDPVN